MTNADNIRAMLQSVQDELDTLKARAETLKERKATLIQWLKEEAPGPVQSDLLANEGLSPLAAFLSITLTAGKRLNANELGDMAVERGLIQGDISPGRAVHGALIGLMKNGRAKRHSDGTWSLQ